MKTSAFPDSSTANLNMARGNVGSSMGLIGVAIVSMAALSVGRRKAEAMSSMKIRRHAVVNIQDPNDFVAIKVPAPEPPSHREFLSNHAGSAASTGIRFRQNFVE